MTNCSICGSDRLLPGPAYEPDYIRCQDCGSVFNAPVMREPDPLEISIAISEELPTIPVGGFTSPEEAAAHLAKLKEAANRLGKAKASTEDRPAKKKKVHPVSDYPSELIMAELHYFCRKGEGFQTVVSTAKGERDVRNENVLIFAHGHSSGKDCTSTCREILSENN